jgi:hypothetical protein
MGQTALFPLYRFAARHNLGNAPAGMSSVPLAPAFTQRG